MGIVPFIIFFMIIFGKSQKDNRDTEVFKVFFGIALLIAALSVLANPLGMIAVFGIIVFLVKKMSEKKKSDERAKKYGWDPLRWDKERGNPRTCQQASRQKQTAQNAKAAGNTVRHDPLPKSIAKRKRIVEAFNEKYKLCLTPEQIQSIVNSSYMSEIWNREVQSMSQKYQIVYEWFSGYTQWLRVYMYVFHVQEITSDMRQQESIAMYAFEEVFRYADSLPGISTSEKIQRINQQFYTSFDDATFMIAYRFLESKGLKHQLGNPEDLVQDHDAVDELLKKYRTGSEPS